MPLTLEPGLPNMRELVMDSLPTLPATLAAPAPASEPRVDKPSPKAPAAAAVPAAAMSSRWALPPARRVSARAVLAHPTSAGQGERGPRNTCAGARGVSTRCRIGATHHGDRLSGAMCCVRRASTTRSPMYRSRLPVGRTAGADAASMVATAVLPGYVTRGRLSQCETVAGAWARPRSPFPRCARK